MNLFRRWFMAEAPDVLGLLHHQAELILKGLTAFAAWSGTGTETDANAVRETEHEADDARGALLSALGTALVTPVEQEDLYAISERLDRVLNEVKNIVREAQELDWKPGAPAAAMGELAREGVEHLRKAVEQLGRGHTEPGAEADAATKTARRIEKEYRGALAGIPQGADARTAIIDNELHRRYTTVAQLIDRAADRLRYVVLKAK